MRRKVTLIGYIGKMGVGKDTIADLVSKQILYNRIGEILHLPLAYTLKKDLNRIGVNTTEKNNFLRALMQAYGSYRRHEDANYWIKKHLNSINKRIFLMDKQSDIFIQIPDVRFPNEVDYIKINNGIIIEVMCNEDERINRLLKRSNEDANYNHESETSLNNHNYTTIKIENNQVLKYSEVEITKKLNIGVLEKYGSSTIRWINQ